MADWGLLKIKDLTQISSKASLSQIKVLAHKDKAGWELVAKYNIGKRAKQMFYIWHTLLVFAFIAMAFFMGLILGKKMGSKTRNLSLLNKKKDNKFNNLNK